MADKASSSPSSPPKSTSIGSSSVPVPQTQTHRNLSNPIAILQRQQLQQQQQQQQILQQQQQQQSLLHRTPSMSRLNQFQPQQQQQGLLHANLQRTPSMLRLNQQPQQRYNTEAATTASILQQQPGAYGQINLASFTGQPGALGSTRSPHFNLQSSLLTPARHNNTRLLSQSQFNNHHTPTRQGMNQSHGTMDASLPFNSHPQPQQHIDQQHGYDQTLAFLNAQLLGLAQNGQTPLMQTSLLQQSQWLKQLQPTISAPASSSYSLQQNDSSQWLNQIQPAISAPDSSPYILQPNDLSQQQQQLNQIQPAISVPGSSSYNLQQQQQQRQKQPAFLQQQLVSSPQLIQQAMALNPPQMSQLVQEQRSQLGSQHSQLQQQQQQQQLQLQAQQNLQEHHLQNPLQQRQQIQQSSLQQQQSPRMSGSTVYRSLPSTGPQSDPPASGAIIPGGSSSHGTEANNHLLGKRKIQDLVAEIDPLAELAPEVINLLLEMADDFINSSTTAACRLAKHRKSSTLDTKDMALHLEKNYQLSIPGFTSEEQRNERKPLSNDLHERVEMVRVLMEASCSENNNDNAEVMEQGTNTPVGIEQSIRSPGSEEHVSESAGSPTLEQERHD